MGPFDAGFDENAAKARSLVAGVSVGSNAYRAGLRDGQKIASWSLHDRDRKVTAEVTIEDGGTKRTIRYLPEGKPMSVPVFALVERMPDACRKVL